MKWLVVLCLLLLPDITADEIDERLKPPPTPKLTYIHDRESGDLIISFQSDSNDPRDLMNPKINRLRSVWYLLEVWIDDLFGFESGGWARPLPVIIDAPFNTTIQFRTNTKMYHSGMMRIISVWGA